MGKSIVSIAKGEDVQELVHEVLAPLGGAGALVRPKSTVVIKPNAGHAAPAESSVNTNPELVAAVIREIRKAEPKEIIVAEAAAIGCDTMECLEACGIGGDSDSLETMAAQLAELRRRLARVETAFELLAKRRICALMTDVDALERHVLGRDVTTADLKKAGMRAMGMDRK